MITRVPSLMLLTSKLNQLYLLQQSLGCDFCSIIKINPKHSTLSLSPSFIRHSLPFSCCFWYYWKLVQLQHTKLFEKRRKKQIQTRAILTRKVMRWRQRRWQWQQCAGKRRQQCSLNIEASNTRLCLFACVWVFALWWNMEFQRLVIMYWRCQKQSQQ